MVYNSYVHSTSCISSRINRLHRAAHVPLKSPTQQGPRSLRYRGGCVVRNAVDENEVDVEQKEEDLESQVEAFMKEQAVMESGYDVVQLGEVVGESLVPEERAKEYCRDIVDVIKKLQESRDMTYNEIKLTVAIDDPIARDQRAIGIENDSGASRDDMANALDEVNSGRIPKDRIALKALWEEMLQWPFLDSTKKKPSKGEQNVPNKSSWRDGQARPPIGRDKDEKPQSLGDILPDWMGYSAVYLVSAIPIFIGLFVVATLFVNSLN